MNNGTVSTAVNDWTIFPLPIASYNLMRVATSTKRSTFVQIAYNEELTNEVAIHVNKTSITDTEVTSYVLVLSML